MRIGFRRYRESPVVAAVDYSYDPGQLRVDGRYVGGDGDRFLRLPVLAEADESVTFGWGPGVALVDVPVLSARMLIRVARTVGYEGAFAWEITVNYLDRPILICTVPGDGGLTAGPPGRGPPGRVPEVSSGLTPNEFRRALEELAKSSDRVTARSSWERLGTDDDLGSRDTV